MVRFHSPQVALFPERAGGTGEIRIRIEQAGEGSLLPQKSEPLEELTRGDDLKSEVHLVRLQIDVSRHKVVSA